jgi:hypothetical protein
MSMARTRADVRGKPMSRHATVACTPVSVRACGRQLSSGCPMPACLLEPLFPCLRRLLHICFFSHAKSIFAGRSEAFSGRTKAARGECAPPLTVCRRRVRMPLHAMMSLQYACCWPRDCGPSCRHAAARHARPSFSLTSHLSARQPLSSHCAPARLRSIARQPIAAIAAVHEYLPVCTRAYAHALCAATESETSNFDHEQIGTMGWQCPECNIRVEPGSKDTSQCAVSHNYLRTRAILTLRQILHSSHCTVFS